MCLDKLTVEDGERPRTSPEGFEASLSGLCGYPHGVIWPRDGLVRVIRGEHR